VTEAHKDFCANTAFRWDIYSKAPKAMPTVQDRLREVDDLHYRIARPGIALPFKANLGVVTSTVQGPLYQALLGMLGERSMPMSAIVASDNLEGAAPDDIVRAVDAGVAMSMFDVMGGPLPVPAPVPDTFKLSHGFNRAILNAEALGGRVVALASETTGTGHVLSDFDAAILHELVERGRDGLADRVESRLAGSGRSLQQNGQPVTDPAARKQIIEQACSHFLGNTLPVLAQFGIISKA
jgi:hypothetical protein